MVECGHLDIVEAVAGLLEVLLDKREPPEQLLLLDAPCPPCRGLLEPDIEVTTVNRPCIELSARRRAHVRTIDTISAPDEVVAKAALATVVVSRP